MTLIAMPGTYLQSKGGWLRDHINGSFTTSSIKWVVLIWEKKKFSIKSTRKKELNYSYFPLNLHFCEKTSLLCLDNCIILIYIWKIKMYFNTSFFIGIKTNKKGGWLSLWVFPYLLLNSNLYCLMLLLLIFIEKFANIPAVIDQCYLLVLLRLNAQN